MPKRAKPGDVVEVRGGDGLFYLHYLGRHPQYGDGVKVCMRAYQSRPKISPDMFREGYVTFYPVCASVAKGFSEVVGRLLPEDLPTRLRRPGAMSGRRVDTWVIRDASGEVVRRELSDEERRIPIAAIWNHEFLVQRLTDGWRPEMSTSHMGDLGGEPG